MKKLSGLTENRVANFIGFTNRSLHNRILLNLMMRKQ